MIKMTEKYALLILLALILLVGGFLRLSGLADQAMIFYDEGQILRRAVDVKTSCAGRHQGIPTCLYIDSKLFWISLIALGRSFLENSFWVGKMLSAWLGIATILVTYLLAGEFYRSQRLALWSAFFLAVSNAHTFYSRLVLPDAGATFFSLLGIYFYLKGTRGSGFAKFAAGVVLGFAFLTHFRIAPFLVFCLLLEIHQAFARQEARFASIIRYATMVSTCLLTVTIFEILIVSLTGLSFLDNVFDIIQSYSRVAFEPFAFFAFPYFVYLYDGILPVVLLAFSFFFVKGKYPTGLFFIFMMMQLIFYVISPFKYARVLSPVLPVLSILVGATLENILELSRVRRFQKIIATLVVFILSLYAYQTFRSAAQWKANIRDVAAWVKTYHDGEKTILATNAAILSGYLPGRAYYLLLDQGKRYLPWYFENGVNLLMIDPHKYAMGAYNNPDRPGEPLLIKEVEQKCRPLASFPAFSPALFERFMHEHTYPTLRQTLKVARYVDDNTANRIAIYDICACLKAWGEEITCPSP